MSLRMFCCSQEEGAALLSGDGEDEESSIGHGRKSKLGNFLRILLVFGSAALAIIATFQSIIFFSKQNLHPGYLTLVCTLAAAAHLITVALLSSTRFTSSRTNFFIGCLASALSTGALLPIWHLTFGTVQLIAQRLIQEIGFALLLHALPAILWNEMPSSVHYMIPLLTIVRGSTALFSPLFNNWLEVLNASAPIAVVSSGLSVMALLSYSFVGSTPRFCRVASISARYRLSLSWALLFVIFMVFNNVTTVAFMSLLSWGVFAQDQENHHFVMRLVPSGILYFLSGPLAAVSIRWLPPRGFILLISTVLNIAALILVNYVSSLLLPLNFGFLAMSYGAQIALLNIHLVEALSRKLNGRHDVVAGRIISTVFSLSCIVSFLLPSWFRFLASKQFSIFESVYLLMISNGIAFVIVLVPIIRELCAK